MAYGLALDSGVETGVHAAVGKSCLTSCCEDLCLDEVQWYNVKGLICSLCLNLQIPYLHLVSTAEMLKQ